MQADISSPGIADSFLKGAHVSHTRKAHQITATALNVLQHQVYVHYCQTQTVQPLICLRLGAARELKIYHSFGTGLLYLS